MKLRQKAQLFTELAKLVQSGFPIEKACHVVLDTAPPPGAKAWMQAVPAGIRSGMTLAEAFAAAPDPPPKLDVHLIRAGERGGNLADAFAHLGDYYQMVADMQRRARASLLYPLVLLHAGVIMPAVVYAAFQGRFDRIPLYAGAAVGALWVLLVAAWVLWRVLDQAAATSGAAEAAFRILPLAGKARRALALARFAKVFQLHLVSAHWIDESARHAAEAANSASVTRAGEAIAAAAGAGSRIGEAALRCKDALTPAFAASIKAGEEAGTLDEDFGRWAQAFKDQASAAMDQLSFWLPRLVYFFAMAVAVAAIFYGASQYFGMLKGIVQGAGL